MPEAVRASVGSAVGGLTVGMAISPALRLLNECKRWFE